MQNDDYSKWFFHTPEDIATSYVSWAEELAAAPGLTWGVPSIDKGLLSLRPGNRLGIIARPGHGKSTLLAYLINREAHNILKRGAKDEAVYYVSWDQPSEENDAYFQARGTYAPGDMLEGKVDLDLIRKQSAKRLMLPIYHIGVSRRHRGYKRPPMPTMEQVVTMIENYQFSNKIKPTLIVLDYIQKVRMGGSQYRGRGDRTAEVTEAIFAASDMAMMLDCPLAIGVQAGRGVKDRKIPIPTLEDAQWASALEQEMDRLISAWMPVRDMDPTKTPTIEIAGAVRTIDENLLVIRNLKQRFAQGFGLWSVRIDIPKLHISDYARTAFVDLPSYNGDDDDSIEEIPW